MHKTSKPVFQGKEEPAIVAYPADSSLLRTRAPEHHNFSRQFCKISNFDRQQTRGEGFEYTIKKARLFVGMNYEKLAKKGNAGGIFGVKNLLGWTDKQEIKQEITETKQIFKIGDKEIEF